MVEALHHRFEGVLLGQEGVLIRPDELALGLDCRIAHRAASAWECVEQLIQRLLHRLSIALPLQGKAGDQRLGGIVRPPAAELYGVFLGAYNIIRLSASPPSRQGPAGSSHGEATALSALTTAMFRSRATASSWNASSSTSTSAPAARACAAPAARSRSATTTPSGTRRRCTSGSSAP